MWYIDELTLVGPSCEVLNPFKVTIGTDNGNYMHLGNCIHCVFVEAFTQI